MLRIFLSRLNRVTHKVYILEKRKLSFDVVCYMFKLVMLFGFMRRFLLGRLLEVQVLAQSTLRLRMSYGENLAQYLGCLGQSFSSILLGWKRLVH